MSDIKAKFKGVKDELLKPGSELCFVCSSFSFASNIFFGLFSFYDIFSRPYRCLN